MCTAVTFHTKDFYFGRNLDLERSYGEQVTITPRNYPIHLQNGDVLNNHYAMIGMATVVNGYPLYFDAINEKGLCMAALNFPDNACYYPFVHRRTNITSFELIPWLLGKCCNATQALAELKCVNLWNAAFSRDLPPSPLHWILADKTVSFTLEPLTTGLHISENPVGILTNNPPFDYHLYHLADYMNLTSKKPENRFSNQTDLQPYSLGMGSIGLPGDMSSASRFVKAAFTKLNSVTGDSESESISQFFHILSSVVQPRGLTEVEKEKYEFTLYSSCCNADRGIYYYTTYENNQITAVDLHQEDMNGSKVISYPLITGQQICYQNEKKC